jgi:meso-butanediol dehydrogenase/(S,S)-butanediol dehydrogenase/diacetyl reductase
MGLLEHKVAIITGGSSGIGLEIAKTFHNEGARIAVCGRGEAALAKAKKEISQQEKDVRTIPADVTREEDIQHLIKETVNTFGGVDIMVNAAGMMLFRSFEEMDTQFLENLFRVNTFAVSLCIARVIPIMQQRGGGSIINISSLSGLRPNGGSGGYCASKAAVNMLTEVAALEYASHNIRVNALAPGLVEDTELGKEMFDEQQRQAAYARFADLHPLGRNGKPRDIAHAALFLASEQSSWITGAVLPVDGGRNLTSNG